MTTMVGAVKDMNGILMQINRSMKLPEINAILREFQKQNDIMEEKQEMIETTMDEALATDNVIYLFVIFCYLLFCE
jgi:charged multivesicular body protein 2A